MSFTFVRHICVLNNKGKRQLQTTMDCEEFAIPRV